MGLRCQIFPLAVADSRTPELTEILRGGTGAIAKWGGDGKDPFVEFRDSTLEELLARGRERDGQKEVEIKLEAGEEVDEESKKRLEAAAEAEAERLLLTGREVVNSRQFEGQRWERSVSRLGRAASRFELIVSRNRTSRSGKVRLDLYGFFNDAETLHPVELDRTMRAANSRTVMLDGYAVSAETLVSTLRFR